jgi:hypothetical protein
MGDEFLGAGIGKPCRDLGQDTEFLVKQPDGQETGIGDYPPALKIHGDLLPVDAPEGKLPGTLCRHDESLHVVPKWLEELLLGYSWGLFFQDKVRKAG